MARSLNDFNTASLRHRLAEAYREVVTWYYQTVRGHFDSKYQKQKDHFIARELKRRYPDLALPDRKLRPLKWIIKHDRKIDRERKWIRTGIIREEYRQQSQRAWDLEEGMSGDPSKFASANATEEKRRALVEAYLLHRKAHPKFSRKGGPSRFLGPTYGFNPHQSYIFNLVVKNPARRERYITGESLENLYEELYRKRNANWPYCREPENAVRFINTLLRLEPRYPIRSAFSRTLKEAEPEFGRLQVTELHYALRIKNEFSVDVLYWMAKRGDLGTDRCFEKCFRAMIEPPEFNV